MNKTFTVTATVIDGKQRVGEFSLSDAFVITKMRLLNKRLTRAERVVVQTAIGFYAIATLGREI